MRRGFLPEWFRVLLEATAVGSGILSVIGLLSYTGFVLFGEAGAILFVPPALVSIAGGLLLADHIMRGRRQ